jgi:hypothetical protein
MARRGNAGKVKVGRRMLRRCTRTSSSACALRGWADGHQKASLWIPPGCQSHSHNRWRGCALCFIFWAASQRWASQRRGRETTAQSSDMLVRGQHSQFGPSNPSNFTKYHVSIVLHAVGTRKAVQRTRRGGSLRQIPPCDRVDPNASRSGRLVEQPPNPGNNKPIWIAGPVSIAPGSSAATVPGW